MATKKIGPTRFYLDRGQSEMVKLCWFKENKECEMMFGFYGLSSEPAVFANEYADRIVSKEEMKSLRVNYKDAQPRQHHEKVNHFIMHKDGRFHLKLKGGMEEYVHRLKGSALIDKKTGEFLDFFIFSDLSLKYKAIIQKPKNPYVLIPAGRSCFIVLRGRFSGADFDLERAVAAEEKINNGSSFFALQLNGQVLRGMFTFQLIDSQGIDLSKRPDGTYLLMCFPINSREQFLIKTFVFN